MANVPYSSVPSVEPTSGGSGATYGNVPEASPAAFGAQIGQADEKLGATAADLGKMYQQRANEASANDKIVNQWAPEVTKLSQDYYSKQGKDAVAAFGPYMQSLQQKRTDILQDATPEEARLLSGYMTQHIAQEYNGAMRHQVQQMDVYENQMSDAFVNLQKDEAIAAGSNPDVINKKMQAGSARLQIYGLDTGESPEMIQQKQRDFIGKTAQGVISSAVTRGDLSFANSYYANNKAYIPGAQQIEIDRTLHAENMRTFGNDSANAIINGTPLPHPANGGAAATDVKSTVAGAAQTAGVDPNSSLMIAGIESSFGQNVGSRGDVGQTGKPAASITDQAKNLVDAQKQAQEAANKVVGGTAQPWQMYTVYQQGLGGGVALLNPENANKKAVDVVSQFYKNPKDALAAIQNNGGNATMTSSQFTDMLKQKCDTVYGQVKCETTTPNGQPIDLSKAIVDPHQTGGITLQPAATPVKALQAFDAQYPSMLQRAQEIPNLDQRSATMEALESKHRIYQQAALAWKNQFSGQIQDIVTKPDFTSINDPRLTTDMRSAMADDPAMLTMARNMAKANAEEGMGKDSGKLGTSYWDTFKKINSGEITNVSQLNQLAGTGLTREGLTQAQKDLEVASDYNSRKTAAFSQIETSITHGTTSPMAKAQWEQTLPVLLSAIKDRDKRDIPPAQYFDPSNKEWIGNDVKVLQMNKSKAVGSQINANINAVKERTLGDILADAKATNDPAVQARLRQEAIDRGFYNPNVKQPPQVPLAGN